MVDKVFDSAAAAVADIPDGASVSISGFGITHRFPATLITALRDAGPRELTVYCNGLGHAGQPTAQMLAESKQLRRLVASFSARPGAKTAAEMQIQSGELELELVPQGTLVERMRAGGAGIPAFFTPTGAGTAIADGKDVRWFDGRPHILERAIRTDYALLRGYRADRMGNVQFRGASRNFNDSFAKAARVAIIEVDEVLPTGELDPADVHLPGVFVSRVVQTTIRIDVDAMPRKAERPAASGREYLGKPALTRAEMARRVAALFTEGQTVNLGAGLPTQVTNWLPGKGVILHGENGLLNYGGFVGDGPRDPDLHDAGGNFITLNPGASFFDSVTSFELARSGRLDAVVLGAYQVSATGDLANYAHAGIAGGGIGGAMDLAVGARQVVAMLEHRDSTGRPKLVERCEYPVTAVGCVDLIVTDLAVLRRNGNGFQLTEVADGFTPDEVLGLTTMTVDVAPVVGVMQENW